MLFKKENKEYPKQYDVKFNYQNDNNKKNNLELVVAEILDNTLEIKEIIQEELQFTHKDFFVWLIAILGMFGIALAIIFFIL